MRRRAEDAGWGLALERYEVESPLDVLEAYRLLKTDHIRSMTGEVGDVAVFVKYEDGLYRIGLGNGEGPARLYARCRALALAGLVERIEFVYDELGFYTAGLAG